MSEVTSSQAHPFTVGHKLGFIGVGIMNGAIISGICKLSSLPNKINDNFSYPIFVSPRGKTKVEKLLAEYGQDKIMVCQNNQDVLNHADVIFIGVRPEQV